MNLFKILGPVMVGPSSSHTAGVVRIGNVVYQLFGGVPSSVVVKFHGSFAKTYRGHGSDKAIIAGILGFPPDDERIRESLELGAAAGVEFNFETIELPEAHPNTVVVVAKDAEHTIELRGESIGGGNIRIRKINDIDLEFDGSYDTLIINHLDHCGVIAYVAGVLTREKINIARMIVYRSSKGGKAIMIIEADGSLDRNLGSMIAGANYVLNATVIQKIKA